ncbi:alpha-2-macroglobulin-like [Cottoperca gobio]|uniref:Alpha-2-macroglobulin-like n=1 Tax=Cottoperca gobio TaxID=56716 RepID=A0A6J2QUP3_COTGO|nr:alpha-2-macroglobulin-like [Cottoperca gobio]
MGLPGIQMWTQTLCVLISVSLMSMGQAIKDIEAGPQYMVAIPAVLEAGAETQFCVSVLQPNETLVITVTLMSEEMNNTLFQQTCNKDFHRCAQFKVPLVKEEVVQNFQVEVRGNTFYSRETRKVLLKVYRPLTFVQTDKPIYLPGQTVQFRVVSLDSKLKPAIQIYNSIEIEDASNNRIGQWLNETSSCRILEFSFPLNSEAHEGTYKVTVTTEFNTIFHSFKVEKYVLPKFDVKIVASDEVSIEQEEIKVEVCSTYTFGQPVPGIVIVGMCRPLNHYINRNPQGEIHDIIPPCYKEAKQTDKKGCATFIFPMSIFTLAEKVVRDVLQISAIVEEEGTGISRPQDKNIRISYVSGKLSFFDSPAIYDEGSNVEGKVRAVHYNNTPIPNMPVYLFEGERWAASSLQNLTTDSNGSATFSFSTADLKGDIHLWLSSTPTFGYPPYREPFYEAGEHRVSVAQLSSPDTKTVSFLEVKKKDKALPCGKEEDISIKYTVVGEAQGTVVVMYLVLARGAIVVQGVTQVEVQDKLVNEGEVTMKLTVSPDMAPEIQVVVYAILPSETVIAISADFLIEKCFSHKVSLEFSPSSPTPGEASTLQVNAQPDSLCGISIVDQSVLLKEPGKTLEADTIFEKLPVQKATYIPYKVQDLQECLNVRPRRSIIPFPNNNPRDDAYTIFENVGMKLATNLLIREPSCLKYKGREYHQGRGIAYGEAYPIARKMDVEMLASPANAPSDNSPIETVRTFFPETWMWDMVEIGNSGTLDVSLTVPDTITTWETEAFCLSPQGFGLAPRLEITVFQPFFLELTLPYSIIRGEHFELKATVFNYLTSCIMVSVTPEPSLDYTLTPFSSDQFTTCLCGGERKTFSWTMDASAIGVLNVTVSAEAVPSIVACDNEIVSVPARGRIDVVTRSLIVKAEGTEITKTYNWLLCSNGEPVTESIDLQLPQNVIDGSARALISVLGDILGRALKNLDGLLQMPYGCGEQNMALLAPNIYILQYLQDTQQLTPKIREKAIDFLISGYQRQLNYKHADGAFSTFGTGSGNTWLTAFVLRSFTKAQSFIFIDPANIKDSLKWLQKKQRENGCFEQLGKLFHNRMKGGVSDEVTLSAYITASFLEMNMTADNPVVKQSLSCLKESMKDLSNTYTTALLSYVFTLAGDMQTRALLLNHLDTIAVQEGGFLHWNQKSSETSASLSVEISSYVLLAKLSACPTTEDLGYANRIVRWLSNQQNHYGGFSSTQDTVVALQALALYSTLVFSPGGSSTVTVQSPSGPLTFEMNQNNKLLYQEKLLQDVTGKYTLEVKGSTCAAIQISQLYNIPTPTDVTTLSVIVTSEANCTSNKITLNMKSLYSGEEKSTNMVILDIKMLSGFAPHPESLKRLKGALLVDRVDQKDDHVLVYIQELPKDIAINHSLELIQELPVQNLKPAVVKIYDYYQPSDQADTEYVSPCVTD